MYSSLKKQSNSKSANTITQLQPQFVRFTKEEDSELIKLVSEYGTRNWKVIAEQLNNKHSPRQCRERWNSFLSPEAAVGFTKMEDELLYKKHQELGSDWARIATFFRGKSPSQIKNRYHIVVRHMLMKPIPDLLEHKKSMRSTRCVVSIIDGSDFSFGSGGGLHAEDWMSDFLKDLNDLQGLPDPCQLVISGSKSPCSSKEGTNPGESGCQEKLEQLFSEDYWEKPIYPVLAPTKLYQPKGVNGGKSKSQRAIQNSKIPSYSCIR